MKRPHSLRVVVTAFVAIGGAAAAQAQPAAPNTVSFNRDIRPIMSDTCFACHGPATQKAKLRLDVRDDALKVTKSGITPIVPGKPEQSEIIKRIFTLEEDEIMPPADSHKTLTQKQKETIKRWVADGAVYQRHWAFEAPVKAALPTVNGLGYRVNNAIDAFIADRLRREGLTMSPEADKPTLIRRVAIALTGLPPAPAEVDAFLADKSDKAYENMVDRYLDSPRFGEEMARHWLDVARYADTHGLHLDNERQMWAYRDYVIESFNDNKPFDEFTIEQLAGDLMDEKGQGPRAKGQGGKTNPKSEIRNPKSNSPLDPRPSTLGPLTATGFLRCNVTTGEGGSIDAEWVFRNAVDRTSTTAQVFMGLTAGCAVCHDHKFDPLSQKEYYSLYAFFLSAADPPLDGNALLTAPSIKLSTPDSQKKQAEIDAQIAVKQQALDGAAAALTYTDPAEAQPAPAAQAFDVVWFDDEFPAGGKVFASPGHPTTYVTAQDGKVLSGKKALKRVDKGLAQDVVEGTAALEIPAEGKLFVHVFIDPNDVPKTLMIQFFKGGWLHRGLWGDYDAIPWGAANTTERVRIGDLPKAGEWVRLEVDAAKIGLKPGDSVTGFAFTQFGGTVYWDKAGVTGRSDPAGDPRRSLLAFWKQQKGKDTAGAPGDVNAALKAGPEKKPAPELLKKVRDYYLQHVCVDTKAKLQPIANELAALRKQRTDAENNVPGTFVFRDLPTPRQAHVMLRGAYDKPGDKVEPGVPAVLPALKLEDPKKRPTRLDLAKWLTAPGHPLTARVQVNRLWQQFFGTGIVKSSDDFGSQGTPPSHPELLDWLAIEFIGEGQGPGDKGQGSEVSKSEIQNPKSEISSPWDTKRLVKFMLMSAAFRQSSRVTPELYQRDPENRLYARGPRFRLDAEQIRDNALYVSGLINLAMGGRGTQPYQPPNIWEPVGFTGSNTANYRQDKGDALYRRSIYVFLKRTAPPPFMVNFDGPAREAFCAKRDRSNSPLQALQLMNDVQHIEAARALAQRMMTEPTSANGAGAVTPADRIAFAYRVVLARQPASEETAIIAETFARHLAKYQKSADAAKKLITTGESKPKPELNESELAAWTMVANLVLNLDETLNRN